VFVLVFIKFINLLKRLRGVERDDIDVFGFIRIYLFS